jgi:hypothetical protein
MLRSLRLPTEQKILGLNPTRVKGLLGIYTLQQRMHCHCLYSRKINALKNLLKQKSDRLNPVQTALYILGFPMFCHRNKKVESAKKIEIF